MVKESENHWVLVAGHASGCCVRGRQNSQLIRKVENLRT